VEAQRIELKSVQQERNAVKKLENVKRDHESRILALAQLQDLDRHKGELIEMNSDLVNSAIKVTQIHKYTNTQMHKCTNAQMHKCIFTPQVILSAIANQIPWDQIREIIREATESGDPVAGRIKQVRLETNHIVMQLADPYAHLDPDEEEGEEAGRRGGADHQVDIDLGLTAQANARKYFVQKKTAAVKERKTVESGGLALKSAEKKTKQALKEMAKISNIIKARKVYWFEKFFWFISTVNYLVIGGRDAQQNELLVKRYMKVLGIWY
jgi:predicted ribosome quality control (RQC) complex YloA/Tae2 family protein